MRLQSKTVIQWLLIGTLVALAVAGCAPRATIPAPRLPPDTAVPAPDDRRAYRMATELAQVRSAKAPEAFRTFIARFPSSPLVPRALLRLGDLLQERGDLVAARDAYRRLLANYGQHPLATQAAVEMLATYYKQGDFESLLSRSQALADIPLEDTQRQRIRQMRIDAFLALGRSTEAAETAIEAWQAAPETQREPIAEKLALAISALPPAALTELQARPMAPEAQRLVIRLARERAYDRNTLGCMLPLSGAYAVYGQRALRGIETALSRFTSLAATSAPALRLVVEDTGSQPDRAASVVQALADRRVAAIVGPMATAAQAAAEAQRQGIPIVTFTQREQIPAIGDYVFRHFITARSQAKALVNWAVERQSITRFAVLYPAEKYGRTFLAYFTDAVAAQGGQVTGTVAYAPDNTDFAGPIRDLVSLKNDYYRGFDALFIPDGPAKVGLILPQLAFHDLTDVMVMGTNLWQSRTLIQMARDFVEGVVFSTGFFEDDPDYAVAEFVANFKNDYGETPGFVEAVAYDTAMLLFDVLGRPEIGSRSEIRNALATGSPRAMLTGETVFDPGGEAYKSLSIITIQNGRFALLDRASVTLEPARPSVPPP